MLQAEGPGSWWTQIRGRPHGGRAGERPKSVYWILKYINFLWVCEWVYICVIRVKELEACRGEVLLWIGDHEGMLWGALRLKKRTRKGETRGNSFQAGGPARSQATKWKEKGIPGWGRASGRESRVGGVKVEMVAGIRNPLETPVSLDDILCCKDFRGSWQPLTVLVTTCFFSVASSESYISFQAKTSTSLSVLEN